MSLKEKIHKTLKELVAIPGISGAESENMRGENI